MYNARTMLLFLIFSGAVSIAWSVLFVLPAVFRVQLYKLDSSRVQPFLKKHVCVAAVRTSDDVEQWVLGKWFIGFLHHVETDHNTRRTLYLLCTQSFYEKHVQQREDQTRSLSYWHRQGVFWRLEYTRYPLPVPVFEARPYQQRIIEQIMDVYTSRSHAVALLTGSSGGGKSMTPRLLCKHIMAQPNVTTVHLCDTHAPYDHGDNFFTLFNKVQPSAESPLVVVLDEIDICMDNLHHGRVVQKHHIPVQLKNKTDWNAFMDAINYNMYPHCIFVFTSNKSAQYFDALDESYMSPARVHVKVHV